MKRSQNKTVLIVALVLVLMSIGFVIATVVFAFKKVDDMSYDSGGSTSGGKSAASTVAMLDKLEKRLGTSKFKCVFKTITCDNGSEFADYPGMELSTRGNSPRTSVYYCHPYCSSERGSNENQNRILRRFIKKGVPISFYSNKDIANACNYLNDMPRKLFGWQTARERFHAELSTLGINFFEKNAI